MNLVANIHPRLVIPAYGWDVLALLAQGRAAKCLSLPIFLDFTFGRHDSEKLVAQHSGSDSCIFALLLPLP